MKQTFGSRFSKYTCLDLAFTLILDAMVCAVIGAFVSEQPWEIGLRLAVLVGGCLALVWIGTQLVQINRTQKRTFAQALATNSGCRMLGVWTVALYFLVMHQAVPAWLLIAGLLAAGGTLYVRSRRAPDQSPESAAESEKK